MNKSKGFTIIELIVVIAIIAVLAAIVLVNVTSYITKGRDTAAKGDLATLLTNAAVYYDNHSNYDGFTADPLYTNVTTSLGLANNGAYTVTPACDTDASCGAGKNTTKFCACIKELSPTTATYYCIDTTGNKREEQGTACASECSTISATPGICL